jgi:RNA polymerase sigma factor (sigma-70 family)
MNVQQEQLKTPYERNTRLHEHLIRNVLRSFLSSKADYEDLMQVGRIAAYQASAAWKPTTAVKYQTFVSFEVMKACRRFLHLQAGSFQLESRMTTSVCLVLDRRDQLEERLGWSVTAEEVYADFKREPPVITLRNDVRNGKVYKPVLWSLARVRTVFALEPNLNFLNVDDVGLVHLHPKTVFESDALRRFEIEDLFARLLLFDRRILVLASQGFDTADIAQILGLNFANVKTRLYFARKRARREAERAGLFVGRYTGDYDILGLGNPDRLRRTMSL